MSLLFLGLGSYERTRPSRSSSLLLLDCRQETMAGVAGGTDGQRSARGCLVAAQVLASGGGLAAGENAAGGAKRGLALLVRTEELLHRQGVRIHRGGGGGATSSREIPTSHLPFAVLPWLASQLIQRGAPVGGAPDARAAALRDARARVVEYLTVAQALTDAFHEAGESPAPMEASESAFLERLRADDGAQDSGGDAHAARSEKVDRTRRTAAARKRADEIRATLSAAAAPTPLRHRLGMGEVPAEESDEDVEAVEDGWGDEEAALRRELAVLELRLACMEAVGELGLLDREVEILAHMASMGAVQLSPRASGLPLPPAEGRRGQPIGRGMPRDPHGLLNTGQRLPDGSVKLGPGDVPAGGLLIESGTVKQASAEGEGPVYYALGPVSSMGHVGSARPQQFEPAAPFAMRSRLEVADSERARIFQPTVALPTMTVEEYGEHARVKMERDAAEHAEYEQAQARADDLREHDQGEEGEALREEQRMQAIATDDMKEANPRGWGNKNQNYFARG